MAYQKMFHGKNLPSQPNDVDAHVVFSFSTVNWIEINRNCVLIETIRAHVFI